MSHPDEEILAALALGEDREDDEAGADREDAALAAGHEHVDSCAECSAVVEALEQTAALVRSGAQAGAMTSPPPGVWSRVEASLAAETHSVANAASEATATAATPPGAGSPLASPSVRPLEAVPGPARRAPRGLPLGWGLGLAAAGIAIGLLTGRTLWQEPAAPVETTIATAELDTLDTRARLGDAALVRGDDGIDLRVATSPLDPGDGYLEVWLINSDGKRMISVGVLRGDGPETFPVSQTLIDEGYVIVDISREGFDDRPEHSGDSVARGTLPT